MTSPTFPKNPFIGPRPFHSEEKLYGRDQEVRRLVELLIAERLVLLYSPSGAGKTSLIQAALISELKNEGFRVTPSMRVGLEIPSELPATDKRTNRYLFSALQSLESGGVLQKSLGELGNMSFSAYVEELEALSRKQRLESLQASKKLLLEMSDDEFEALMRRNDDELEAEWGMTAQHLDWLRSASEDAIMPYVEETVEPLALIFDQFEELLTIGHNTVEARQEKEEFISQVGLALRNRNRWALFSMREDYVPALEPYLRHIPTQLRTTFRLDLLNRESALLAVQMKATDQEVRFSDEADDKAAEKLIENLRKTKVRSPDGEIDEKPGLYVEPAQLQVVCRRLWDKLPWEKIPLQVINGKPCRVVKEEHIRGLEDVDDALRAYYAETIQKITGNGAVKERLLREWFDRQLITPQGLRSLVLQGSNESGGLKNEIIRQLVDAYLVRPEERNGVTWYELAHDRLITPVQADNAAWLEENLSLLQRQTALWERSDRPGGLLLLGQDLESAKKWADENVDEITPAEKEFLEKSQIAQRDVDEKGRKITIVRKWAAAASVIGVLAMVSAVWAINAQKNAFAQATKADAERLAADSERRKAVVQRQKAEAATATANRLVREAGIAQRAADEAKRNADELKDLAEMRAKEAEAAERDLQLQIAKNNKTTSALLTAQADQLRIQEAKLLLQTKLAEANANLITENERSLAAKEEANRGRLRAEFYRDIANAQRLAVSARSSLEEGSVRGNREGLAQAVQSVSVLQRSFANEEYRKAFESQSIQTGSLSALRQGVESLSQSLLASVLKSASRSTITPLEVAFSDDGRVVVADEKGRVSSCSTDPLASCITISFPPEKTVKEERSLANKFIDIFNFLDPAASFQFGPGDLTNVALSSSGNRVVFGRDNGKVEVGYLGSGEVRRLEELPRHRHGVHAVGLSDDGKLVASSTNLFSFRVTSLEKRKVFWKRPSFFSWLSVLTSPGKNRLMTAFAFSHGQLPSGSYGSGPDNVLAALSDQYGCTFIREARTGNRLFTIPSEKECDAEAPSKGTNVLSYGNIRAVAFSPDDRALTIAYRTGRIETWNIVNSLKRDRANKSREPPNAIAGVVTGQLHSGAISSIAYSPDGSLLATASQDRTVKIWRVLPPDNLGRIGLELWVSLPSQQGFINDVSFDRTGKLVAVASADNVVKVWDVDSLGRYVELHQRLAALRFSTSPSDFTKIEDLLRRVWDFAGPWKQEDCDMLSRPEFVRELQRFPFPCPSVSPRNRN